MTRSYDAYCTYQLTPNLSKEANPLVTVGGVSSWTLLLIILGICTLYVFYANYISVYKPSPLLPTEKGYSFGSVVAFIYLGFKDSWTSIFYKLPKDIKRFNTYMGHVLTRCLIWAGFVSTVMWLLINHTSYYRSFHSATMVYAVLLTGCFVIGYHWNKTQYKQYLAQTTG